MNLSRPLLAPSKVIFRVWMKLRRLLPRQRCRTFGTPNQSEQPRIEKIFVINLDRRPDRWAEMERELRHVVDAEGTELVDLTVRLSAVDAKDFAEFPPGGGEEVFPFYTLEDQLFVEPQPHALPERVELNRPIPMTLQEIAVAHSHINVWRQIAAGEQEYVLVLEDDVWFQSGFARQLDQAWEEFVTHEEEREQPELLYLSYKEVKNGAQKALLSKNIFRPIRGLWYLSGYVLSRKGAGKLLRHLPCRGPVDLWINHHFKELSVRATRRSIIAQRLDGDSSNSYSILPVLNRIGVIDGEGASLFQSRPTEGPVFVFGPENSGLSSVAMALSMLGYRCCSDLVELPGAENEKLLTGRAERVFDAYVNIGSLTGRIRELRQLYPGAKFIATAGQGGNVDEIIDGIPGMTKSDVVLGLDETNKWRTICEHLRCAPPVCSFPKIADLGQRRVADSNSESDGLSAITPPKRDRSPWVIDSCWKWDGIHTVHASCSQPSIGSLVTIKDSLNNFDSRRWVLRDDTFPGNLALFRPQNVEFCAEGGIALSVREELLGVRNYSAAAVSSCNRYFLGRFEAVIQATNVPGIVTGFFLHRDSPRQEIDVEIAGNRPDRLLTNVFYNPGDEGARYDYGYRGAPIHVDLGFDASQSAHRFAIEWEPGEIRWFVDDRLVHRRVNWDPTPIPHLPMTLHVNSWPTRSKELAGRLKVRLLPATTLVKSITIDATSLQAEKLEWPKGTLV